MALNSGIQTNQILTKDDEVCIPRLSCIPLAVTFLYFLTFQLISTKTSNITLDWIVFIFLPLQEIVENSNKGQAVEIHWPFHWWIIFPWKSINCSLNYMLLHPVYATRYILVKSHLVKTKDTIYTKLPLMPWQLGHTPSGLTQIGNVIAEILLNVWTYDSPNRQILGCHLLV